jgi:hypothetical protein
MTSIQIIGEEDFVLHKKGSENKQEPCKWSHRILKSPFKSQEVEGFQILERV